LPRHLAASFTPTEESSPGSPFSQSLDSCDHVNGVLRRASPHAI
jgi:hypothetical protein